MLWPDIVCTEGVTNMLQAQNKWALSGTPIQNRVQELFSYFHFLQYWPFNTQAAFRQYMHKIEVTLTCTDLTRCIAPEVASTHHTHARPCTLSSRACISGTSMTRPCG